MLGSRTSLGIFSKLFSVLPVMVVGLFCRFVGVLSAVLLTIKARKRKLKHAPVDTAFCFLATLPRATIQGALGAVPIHQRFFQGYSKEHPAQQFIFISARVYIVGLSVVGMTLLNTFGPRLLEMNRDEETSEESEPGGEDSCAGKEADDVKVVPEGETNWETTARALAAEVGIDTQELVQYVELLRKGALSPSVPRWKEFLGRVRKPNEFELVHQSPPPSNSAAGQGDDSVAPTSEMDGSPATPLRPPPRHAYPRGLSQLMGSAPRANFCMFDSLGDYVDSDAYTR